MKKKSRDQASDGRSKTHDLARLADLDLSVRLGHITEDEKILILHYRNAEPETATVFMNLVKSLPRIFPEEDGGIVCDI